MLREDGCVNCGGEEWTKVNKPLTHGKLKTHCLILNKHFPLTFTLPSAMCNHFGEWTEVPNSGMEVSFSDFIWDFNMDFSFWLDTSTMQTLFDERKDPLVEQEEVLLAN